MAVDSVAVLYSVLGGFFMGSYPVSIKSRAVLRLRPHPVIFQCYKSFWTFIAGWFFVLLGGGSGFQFTWWGVASAACWIPAGLSCIVSTPLIGMGMVMILSGGVNSVLSFLVFWLAFGARLVEHGSPGHEFLLAPWYLACILLGLVALVVVPRARRGLCARTASHRLGAGELEAAAGPLDPADASGRGAGRAACTAGAACNASGVTGREAPPQVLDTSFATFALGLCIAIAGGSFSAVQFGVEWEGRALEEQAAGCAGKPSTCPPALRERFNTFGSWMASFGIGAAMVTALFMLCSSISEKLHGRRLPGLHFRDLWLPGSIAGICWSLGNFFQLAAIMRGGPTVMAASNQCFLMVTSGAWGLLYYREIQGVWRVILWIAAAIWTVSSAVLLSGEKAKGP